MMDPVVGGVNVPRGSYSAAVAGPDDARQGIQSVELAMTVLRALEEGRGPMTLTQIAGAAGMSPSKAHRYLVSLCRVGLVGQPRSTGSYDLGPAMRRLGIESLRRMDEVGLVSEHLPGLRDRTGHAINLAVWGDTGPVVVRWDYGSHVLPITVRVGATMPMVTSSVGRVFLAHLPMTLTEPVLRGELESGRRAELPSGEIARIRAEVLRDGYALTTGGVIPGVTSVAAPVFTATGPLPLVVALALPDREASDDVVAGLADELLRTTGAISAELGHTDRRRA
jgi:DNA-binding IclR family transcriptional regulator